MRVISVNGSPRGRNSSSRTLLEMIRKEVQDGTVWEEVHVKSDTHPSPTMTTADILMISFPLYVDGLPSELIRWLEEYRELIGGTEEGFGTDAADGGQMVYAAVNCGFYEGVQNRHALGMLEEFSKEAGLSWGGGIGIGTGGMVIGTLEVPPQAGLKRPVADAVRRMGEALSSGKSISPLYTQHKFPWLLYKVMGEIEWRQKSRANGLSRKDMAARPLGT